MDESAKFVQVAKKILLFKPRGLFFKKERSVKHEHFAFERERRGRAKEVVQPEAIRALRGKLGREKAVSKVAKSLVPLLLK